jgi:hexokinase
MNDIKQKVNQFLKSQNMHHCSIDIEQSCQSFLKEMKNGLENKKSSLDMIPTYIQPPEKIPSRQTVIVVDAGGTNFRVATVTFQKDNTPEIENFRKFPMPGVEKEVSAQQFFDHMAESIGKIAQKSSKIGFCFSYPTKINPQKDGKLIRFSKEIKAKQVQGKYVGKSLLQAIKRKTQNPPENIVVLNDTVTTLLAGSAVYAQKKYSGFIGFILGTGTNTCYIEKNKNIKKQTSLQNQKSMIINVESGGFAMIPQGSADKIIDQNSQTPGIYKFEKMISGAYFGNLCAQTLKLAAENNLFSHDSAENIRKLSDIDTQPISMFLDNPWASSKITDILNNNPADITTACHIIDQLVERSAKLTAVNLSAAAIKSRKGTEITKPICIVAEGTTFYKLNGLKERVNFYLKKYLTENKNIYYRIAEVPNSTLIGAAIAGLTN